MANWRTQAKHTLSFNSNNTTQDKTNARKAPIDDGKGAYTRRHVSRVWWCASRVRQFSRFSGSKVQSFIQFIFIACRAECFQNMFKLSCERLAFNSFKAFLKNKVVWSLSPYLIFCMIFEEKKFALPYFITWPNFIVWLRLRHGLLVNMYIAIVF